MRYIIHLLAGLNDVEFGMAVDAVRQRMSGDFRTFYNPCAPEGHRNQIDAYSELGIYCHYDLDGRLDAVDLWEPAQAVVGDSDWLAVPLAQSNVELLRLDPAAIRTPDGLCSIALSVAITVAPVCENGDAPAQSIFVGRPGYYDHYNEPGGRWWLPPH